ncbi:MAG: ABC transporter permease [Bacteroidales bacterium]|nr:ABC transporter permease [Bacteroidales bacterium]
MLLIELCSPFFTLHLLNGYTFVLDISQMMYQNSWHIAVLLLVGLVVAWLAVIRVRHRSLQESIKSSSGRRPGRHIGRNILLGYQLTLAVFFLSLMSALIMQLRCNRHVFLPQMTEQQQEDCLVATLQGVAVTDELIDELKAFPEVLEVVRYKDGSPLFGYNWTHDFLNEQGDTLQACLVQFTTECLQFLGEAVTQGRYAETPQEVVVDEGLLTQFGLQLGDVIQLSVIVKDENGALMSDERGCALTDWRPHTIVGTVAQLQERLSNNDVRQIFNSIYYNDAQTYNSNNLWIKCYPSKGAKVKALLKERWKDYTGEWWYIDHEEMKFTQYSTVKSFAQFIDENEGPFREFLPFFMLLSALALTLTLIGIYSAVAVDTRFRRKEMAIRKINGAKAWQIAMRFIRLYVIELVVASAIAIPCAYMLIDTIITEMFRVPFAHGIFFYGGVLLIVIVLISLTAGYQIWRISRIEPANVVKTE